MLATEWEGRASADWLARWRVPELHIFRTVGSTNDVARARAAAAAPAGTVVMAELQTAGRGRFGRRWQAPPGSSLLLSCLLRPRAFHEDVPGTVPLRAGMAAAAAIEAVTGVQPSLKWPNDLVLEGAGKLGGILCEAVTTGSTWSVVAGIGVNVHQRDWPTELRGNATSLDLASGSTTDRAALAAALIDALRPLFTAPLRPLSAEELDAFRRRDALVGHVIVVVDDDATARDPARADAGRRRTGTAAGIAPDGALLLRTGDGIERITTGTVRTAGGHEQRPTATAPP